MKKFNCLVVSEHNISVMFDEEIINDEFLKIHSEVFGGCDDLQDHAEHIAWHVAKHGMTSIEGYGFPVYKRRFDDGNIYELFEGMHVKNLQRGIIVEINDSSDSSEAEEVEAER